MAGTSNAAYTHDPTGRLGAIFSSYLPSRRFVWENLDRVRKRRPNAVRSLHTTEVKILPIRCLLYGGNKNNSCNWFAPTDILLANGDEPNIIHPKLLVLFTFFPHQLFWQLQLTLNDWSRGEQ